MRNNKLFVYFQNKNISDGMGVVALTTQIFIVCFFADKIHENSAKLTTQLYKSNWTQLIIARGNGRNFKKMMLILMNCTQNEVTIRLGRIFSLKLSTFAQVKFEVLQLTER